MEQISNAYKKSIKDYNREIKGYVEIVYDSQPSDNYTISQIPNTIEYSKPTEIIDSNRKTKKYASLEPDRTLLDGSFILPNYNVIGDNAGYISNNVFSSIENKNIIITSDDPVTSSGITIYFEDNIPRNFIIKINETITFNVQNNDKSVYTKIFDTPIAISKLSLEISLIEHPNWRLRIPEIDLGISQIYEGGDLVSFSTDESIDLMMEQTPTNTCSVKLSNYDSQFDPLNPKGLTKYLTDNTLIKPFIGVVTENGPEYVGLGYFYIKDWSSDVNGNATINGQSILGKLASEVIKTDGEFYDNKTWYSYALSEYLTKMYGYKFVLNIGQINNMAVSKYNLLNYLQTLASCMTTSTLPRVFYASRKNEIKINSLSDIVQDSITKTELLEDAKYESKSILNTVSFKALGPWNTTSTTKEDVINQKYVLNKTEEYVYFTFSKPTSPYNNNGVFTYTASNGGRADIVDINNNLAYIKFIGTVGEQIAIKYNDYVFDKQPAYETTFSNGNVSGDKLSLDVSDYFEIESNAPKEIASYYLNNDKKYKITGKYNGNPAYLPGDKLEVETKFGKKEMILTRHKLIFDVGLSGTFEGVGNDE